MPSKMWLGLAALVGAAPAVADQLWRQNPVDSSGGYSSQDARNPGGLGWFSETADNFAAPLPWTVTSVEFWGGYGQITPGTMHGVTVRFYADGGGHPGTLLYTQDFTAFTEVADFTGPDGSRYHYTVNVSPAFNAPIGSYWMSVVALVDRGGTSNDPQWYWTQAASGSPPPAEQWFLTPGNFLPQPSDVAFILNGAAQPGGLCYANCDNSTTAPSLNVADFTCFLQQYARGSAYANCDGSTAPPALNVADFSCFLQRYAAGCT